MVTPIHKLPHVAHHSETQQRLMRDMLDTGQVAHVGPTQLHDLMRALSLGPDTTRVVLHVERQFPTGLGAVEKYTIESDGDQGYCVAKPGTPNQIRGTDWYVGQEALAERMREMLENNRPFTFDDADYPLFMRAARIDFADLARLECVHHRVTPNETHYALNAIDQIRHYTVRRVVTLNRWQVSYGLPLTSPLFLMEEYKRMEAEVARHHTTAEGMSHETRLEMDLLNRWLDEEGVSVGNSLILTHCERGRVMNRLVTFRSGSEPRKYVTMDNGVRQFIAFVDVFEHEKDRRVLAKFYTLGEIEHPSGKTLYLWRDIPGEFKQPIIDLYLSTHHAHA